ncbi:MAG: heavy metal sensor histidine kinase [Rhizobacter sp.]|nr:heavy metal sensor histidine kinase [Rhizobacter sp.]
MRLSITSRLVAMFAAATLIAFGLVGTALYQVLAHELDRHQLEELRTDLQNLQYSIERTGTLERWARVQAKMDTLTPTDGRIRFWVLSDDPRFQYGKGLSALRDLRARDDGSGEMTVAGIDAPLRTLSRDIAPLGDRPAVRLIVGSDTAPYQRTMRVFASALTAFALASLLAVALVGSWIARVGLKPLQRLSREAAALRPKARAQRLNVSSLPPELESFAVAFNGAIARLEDAYRQLETFNADVAHELRTPLTNLIGGTQVALSRPRAVCELEEILQSNLEELEALRRIINDMLFLARADEGEVATGLVGTPLAQEVSKTIEFYEVLLEEQGAAVDIEGDVDAAAPIDRALVRRALSNLLQNAIEHAEPRSRIAIQIRAEAAEVWVCVSNRGEPLAQEQLRRLFDRLYRVEAARDVRGGRHGHGLGLAIVKAVATMHGGHVHAASEGAVTTIGFSVPLARASDSAPGAARPPADARLVAG